MCMDKVSLHSAEKPLNEEEVSEAFAPEGSNESMGN